MEARTSNGILTVAYAPAGRKPVGAGLISKLKTNRFGKVTGPMARVVANGFSPVPGVGYDETFAPQLYFVITDFCMI